MRINRWLSQHTSLSRRKADEALQQGRVTINNKKAKLGDTVEYNDTVCLDGAEVASQPIKRELYMLNKPVGYVCSRSGQGSKTIYDLLPKPLHHLNPIGRLDKDSSGLLLLTNDGELLNKLAHPSNNHEKVYEVTLQEILTPGQLNQLQTGVNIDDARPSLLKVKPIHNKSYVVIITEGRNRQIRRSFEAIGHKVVRLHRTRQGPYELANLPLSTVKQLGISKINLSS
ncbi:rRNA pseudouridine synthase [Candidatus Saccharibacteria bacterium]|nr:MAG: rRNA pseudouridine synthase [Candidatus Saccharibacteria bacterium]